MTSFYDEWLQYWDESERERQQARKNIHEEQLDWVETAQDHRAALLVSPETGFRTWGTSTMLGEIPPRSKTGAHSHGEEAIHIVQGSGYSVIEGVRYDWRKGSVLAIPFGAPHQHFNPTEQPVRYLSALTVHLERFVGIHRSVQLEKHGPIGVEPDAPVAPDGYAPDGNRMVLHIEDGKVRENQPTAQDVSQLPHFDPEHPLVVGDGDGMNRMLPIDAHKARVLDFMRSRERARGDMNDFAITSAEISGILTDPPREYGGMHAHMEAHLYILSGSGYSMIGDDEVAWKAGSAIHVPGPQTPHRHVNDCDEPSEMLRVAFGIRYFFEKFATREFPYLYLSVRQGYDAGQASSVT